MRDDAPYGLDDPQQNPDEEVARRRVRPPAILLLIVSVLNILAGLYCMVDGVFVKQNAGDVEGKLQSEWDDMSADEHDLLAQFGIKSPHDLVLLGANFYLILGGVTALVAVISFFGAIRMISLHSYGLAMFGALLTAIPCVTPCCLIGQVAGIWAILILLNPDVRKAFR